MGLFSKLLKKNCGDIQRAGGMEDFMTLIRVYYQATLAQKLGITNLVMLPDLRVFKQTLHVPTVNNRLGAGEKNRCQKMLKEIYGMTDVFFHEIDNSIKKCCHQVQDVQGFLYLFQGFSQDLLTLMSTTIQLKLRIPSFFKKVLYSVIQQGVNDILTKDNWKDEATRKSAIGIRSYQKKLGFSSNWMTEYAYHIIILAKKEKKKKDVEDK